MPLSFPTRRSSDLFALGKRRGIGRQPGAQPLALRDIEHGEALEERHCLGVATLARSPLFLRLGSEAVGIDDGHATLALADAPACFLRLPEGQPRLRRPAMLDDRAPQDQDIDARIVARGQGVARQAGTGAAGRSPWLDPRQAPGLKLGNDPPGHLVIEVRPVLGLTIFARTLAAGTTVGGFSHRYPPSPPKKQQASQIGRAHVELQSLMRISYAVFCLK